MDDGIQFGEVEETAPEHKLRPDQNKHYAVVRYDRPGQEDLPIYIDVDALRDMEAHALSNTSVELGGVLLGGQYLDDEGEPFVVITDALRIISVAYAHGFVRTHIACNGGVGIGIHRV